MNMWVMNWCWKNTTGTISNISNDESMNELRIHFRSIHYDPLGERKYCTRIGATETTIIGGTGGHRHPSALRRAVSRGRRQQWVCPAERCTKPTEEKPPECGEPQNQVRKPDDEHRMHVLFEMPYLTPCKKKIQRIFRKLYLLCPHPLRGSWLRPPSACPGHKPTSGGHQACLGRETEIRGQLWLRANIPSGG